MPKRRPRVLVAINPPLAADLLRRALRQDDVDVVVDSHSFWRVRRWDVAVLPARTTAGTGARYVVVLPGQRLKAERELRTAPDFSSLVALLRWLCGRDAAATA